MKDYQGALWQSLYRPLLPVAQALDCRGNNTQMTAIVAWEEGCVTLSEVCPKEGNLQAPINRLLWLTLVHNSLSHQLICPVCNFSQFASKYHSKAHQNLCVCLQTAIAGGILFEKDCISPHSGAALLQPQGPAGQVRENPLSESCTQYLHKRIASMNDWRCTAMLSKC